MPISMSKSNSKLSTTSNISFHGAYIIYYQHDSPDAITVESSTVDCQNVRCLPAPGLHTNPVTRDREHPESTSAMHFLPLTTASNMGSTSFNLNRERVTFLYPRHFFIRLRIADHSLQFLTLLHCIESLARWFRFLHLKQVTSLRSVLWRFSVFEACSGCTAAARYSSLVSTPVALLKLGVSNLVDDWKSPLT